MGETTQAALFLGSLAVAGLLFGWAFLMQRRRLASGTQVCAVRLERSAGKLVAEAQASLTGAGRLCRLLLALRMEGSEEEPRWSFASGSSALVVGTPYALRIDGPFGEVLYREEGDLARFAGCLGSSESSSLVRRESRWVHHGRFALLEFVPRRGGLHQIVLELVEQAEVETERSSSRCQVVEAELAVMEDVRPLWQSRRYPHRRVQL